MKTDGYVSEYVDNLLRKETDSTDGFRFGSQYALASDNMTVAIDLVNAGGNKWIVSGVGSGGSGMAVMAGEVTLDGALEKVDISLVSGNFDNGMYLSFTLMKEKYQMIFPIINQLSLCQVLHGRKSPRQMVFN